MTLLRLHGAPDGVTAADIDPAVLAEAEQYARPAICPRCLQLMVSINVERNTWNFCEACMVAEADSFNLYSIDDLTPEMSEANAALIACCQRVRSIAPVFE